MDWLGVAALVAATFAGSALVLRPRSSTALMVGLSGFWAAVGLLAWRFISVDLRLVEVATLSRDELSWPLRVAGVWAGSSGSILFWSALVVTVGAVAVGRSPAGSTPRSEPTDGAPTDGAPTYGEPTQTEPTPEFEASWLVRRRIVGLAIIATSLAVIFISQPFDRLAEPAVRGVGLNPVLEHWAMVIHPPLLYSAQAMVLGAALVWRRSDPDVARRWTALAAAMLLSATLLGSWWAHDELGWGGWWAWDPVENTALAPLIALIASLHARRRTTAIRWRRIAAAAVLAGIAVTRSGLPSSVHAFASGGGIAPLFAIAAAVTALSALLPRRGTTTEPTSLIEAATTTAPIKSTEPDSPTKRAGWKVPPRRAISQTPRRLGAQITSLGAAWTLIVIGSGALAAMWLGTRTPIGSVDGKTLGTLLVPVGIALLVGVVALGFRRRQKITSMLAHLGVVLFSIGVIGSLFGSSDTSAVRVDQPSMINGSQVTLIGSSVDESRPDIVRADIEAKLDDRAVTSSIIRYLDLGQSRARPGRLLDPFGETELVVTMLEGDRAFVEVRRHPGLPYVWLGGALIAAALVGSSRRSAHSLVDPSERRRSRLAASNDPNVEPSSGPSFEPAGTDGFGDESEPASLVPRSLRVDVEVDELDPTPGP
ncbi:MAG: cytochrome c biogenesis protein CcsA [Microthrixaceae bacterium]